MPSKYKAKSPKPVVKQGGWQPQPIRPRCTNCGREGLVDAQFSKCHCGGVLQTFGVSQRA